MSVVRVIECPCGAIIQGTDDRSLVEAAQVHARETHAMMLTEVQALAMARPI